MPHFQFIVSALCVSLLAGCSRTDVKERERAAVVDLRSDLDQNGFFRAGWAVSENDTTMDSLRAEVFSRANAELRRRLDALFPDPITYQVECFIVPDTGGYRFVVLSRKRLTAEEAESVRIAAQDALAHARSLITLIWPNKSLQPTATAVMPPAAQEIMPAVAVAER
jgi:hypothetical protein